MSRRCRERAKQPVLAVEDGGGEFVGSGEIWERSEVDRNVERDENGSCEREGCINPSARQRSNGDPRAFRFRLRAPTPILDPTTGIAGRGRYFRDWVVLHHTLTWSL